MAYLSLAITLVLLLLVVFMRYKRYRREKAGLLPFASVALRSPRQRRLRIAASMVLTGVAIVIIVARFLVNTR